MEERWASARNGEAEKGVCSATEQKRAGIRQTKQKGNVSLEAHGSIWRLADLEIEEEGVGLAFFSDGGCAAVAGKDAGVVREGKEAVVNGAEELAGVASGEVGAAHGAGEEGVAGEEEGLGGEVEAEAALGVAGGVEDGG